MLSKRLKLLRENLGLTQTQIAEKLNLSRVNYNRYENGERFPDHKTIMQLAEFFSVTTDYLLGRVENPLEAKMLVFHQNPQEVEEEIIRRYKNHPRYLKASCYDIAHALEDILSNMETEENVTFYSHPLNKDTINLMRISLENVMRLAKEITQKR